MEYKYQVVPKTVTVNLRADHSTTSADVGDLVPGQKAFGNELWADGTQEKWLHALEVNGVAKDCWIAVIHAGSDITTLTDVPVTPSPVASAVDHIVVYFQDGTTQTFIPQ